MRKNNSFKITNFLKIGKKKPCRTMHVFLSQLLRPVAAENSMCRPLKEVKLWYKNRSDFVANL